jgi:hypothetical protein
MSSRLGRFGIVGMILASAAVAAAQTQLPPNVAAKVQEAVAQPTPRTGDGHVDLTGFWLNPAFDLNPIFAGPVPKIDFTGAKGVSPISEQDEIEADEVGPKRRWADKSLRPVYKPEFAKKQEEQFWKADFLDPSYRCEPAGVPRIGPPTEIFQTSKVLIFLYRTGNIYRVIPTDGRSHDPNADAMAMGNSVGHWEGDTLVVDVMNFSPDTWIDRDGSWHDDNMHVIERFTRKGNSMVYEVRVEDPTLFAEPYVPKAVNLLLGPAERHAEEDYPCIEKDRAHMVTSERH